MDDLQVWQAGPRQLTNRGTDVGVLGLFAYAITLGRRQILFRDEGQALALLIVIAVSIVAQVLLRRVRIDSDGIDVRRWRTHHHPWANISGVVLFDGAPKRWRQPVALLHPDGTGTIIASPRNPSRFAHAITERARRAGVPLDNDVHESDAAEPKFRPADLVLMGPAPEPLQQAAILLSMWLAIVALVSILAAQAERSMPTTWGALLLVGSAVSMIAMFPRCQRSRIVNQLHIDGRTIVGRPSGATPPISLSDAAVVVIAQSTLLPGTAPRRFLAAVVEGHAGSLAVRAGVWLESPRNGSANRSGARVDLLASIAERIADLRRWHATHPSAHEPTSRPVDVVGRPMARRPRLHTAVAGLLLVLAIAGLSLSLYTAWTMPSEVVELVERSTADETVVQEVDCPRNLDRCSVLVKAPWIVDSDLAQLPVERGSTVGDSIVVRHDPLDPYVYWVDSETPVLNEPRTVYLLLGGWFVGSLLLQIGLSQLSRGRPGWPPGATAFVPTVLAPPRKRRWPWARARDRSKPPLS